MVLDWASLPPVQRIELMTNHDLAKREKQKLELLRSLLTYFHYATKETRTDVFRAEIERIERYHREFDAGTDEAFASPLFNTKSLFSGEFRFGGRG